jgi:L-aspartate oxidase
MPRYHELVELAPRDVVSRAIVAEMGRTGVPNVFLDLSHRDPGFVRARFPRIYETCLHYGIDLETQPAPVAPAAHYAMGGVRADCDGRTSLAGLYAAGEVACTGVHGANRLASNSLLEGVVFGARAGRVMSHAGSLPHSPSTPPPTSSNTPSPCDPRDVAWQYCGILRDADGLRRAIDLLAPDRSNVATVATLIARCALARRESRGGHYRTDFPEKDPAFAKHSVVTKASDVQFR